MAALRGPDHVIDLANERYFKLVGRDNILGKTLREALPELEGQGFFELLDRVYETGESFVGKGMHVRLAAEGKDRPPVDRYVDFVYQKTQLADGSNPGIFVQGVDVTERETAEQELQKLAAIIEFSDDAIIGTDLSGNIISWNPGAERIFGYSAGEVIGTPIKRLIPPQRQQEEEDIIRIVSRNERIDHRETVRRTKDGQELDVSVTVSPIKDPAGNVTGISKVARDISDRKRTQEALIRSEALFRELADSMPDIVWAARPDGYVDYYNHRWYEFTGCKADSRGNESWDKVLHPDDLKRTREEWERAVGSGEPYVVEYRFRRAIDGSYRWHLGRALPVKSDSGEIMRWFGTSTDIHDHKLLQERNEELLESERAARGEAERVSHMKDEFLATLSHELRTPLHAISGWAQILESAPADEKLVRQAVDVIQRNARAQTKIIEDLLDMSRIISGKVRLDVQPVELTVIVEAAIDTVRPAADAKGVRLQEVLDPTVQKVSGDPNRLHQVFWNLLNNAVKFTPRGGGVTVLLERVESHIKITVTDTGEGMTAEFLPHLFARFRQADAATTRATGGLGLGLSIVKQLVELHGGTVRAGSEGIGKGSTFTVSLPLTPVQSKADEEKPHLEAAPDRPVDLDACSKLPGVRIVVVDDEEDARKLIVRLLENCGANVRSAASAGEALALIREDPPDVLVSDIGMPREDGYMLIQKVRALDPQQGGTVPALALTAYVRSQDRLKALQAGFQAHLSKPVEGAELLTMIASLAGRPSGAP